MAKIPVSESPVGPLVDRVASAAIAGLGAFFVYILAGVAPDPRGLGTHEQLGMMPCSWPEQVGAPCPTCGVTTAACHLVHLQPLAALAAQPFGAVLAACGILAAGYAFYCLATGRAYFDVVVRLPFGTILLSGIGLLLISWLYKYLTFTP